MSSYDERVVELRFDNKQFEDGVKTSLGTLDKLKEGLKIEKSAKSLDGLKNASKGFNMASVESAIDAVNNKFSLMGTIGDQVLRNLTNSAINFGKNIITAIPKQIVEGGKRRAQNIEQAQFQLKGLLGEQYDWDKISEDLDYAVSGTAYGLDQAAKVAAQLKASNIDFGEDMKGALRGISGVAAMTNSSYDDIGRIFAKIAGNGRVMTEELNQFAGRGLNVAAELAKVYQVDEATLREMVTKGQVDFRTFANAMNEAFGEHATKANETFNGALSNIKASLSRMGANFATPIYDNLKDVFNHLLPVMKGIEKLVKPLAASFTKFLTSVVKPLNAWLDSVGDGLTGFLKSIGLVKETTKDVTDAAEGAVQTLEDLSEIVQAVINGEFGNGESRKKALEELGYSYGAVQNKVNELLGSTKRHDEETVEGAEGVISVIDEEAERYKEFTKDLSQWEKQQLLSKKSMGFDVDLSNWEKANLLKKTTDEMVEAETKRVDLLRQGLQLTKKAATGNDKSSFDRLRTFNKLEGIISQLREETKKTGPSMDEVNAKIGRTILGFANAFGLIKDVGGAFIEYIVNPFAEFAIPRALDLFFGLTADLADRITAFRQSVSDSKSIEIFFINLQLRARELYGYLKSMIDPIRDFAGQIKETVVNSEGVQQLVTSFTNLKNLLTDIVTKVLQKIGEKLGGLPDLFSGFSNTADLTTFGKVVDVVAGGLATFIDWLTDGIGAVRDFVSSFDTSNINFSSFKDFFTSIKDISVDRLKELKDNIAGLFGSDGLGGKAVSNVTNIFSNISKLFDSLGGEKIDAKGLKENARISAESIAEGLLEGLAKIDFAKILSGAKTGVLLYLVLQVAGIFKNLKNGTKDLRDVTKNLSKVPKNINKTLEGLQSTFASYQNNLRADTLMKVAIAIGVLTGSLIALTFVDPQKLANVAVDLSLVIGMVALLAAVINKTKKVKGGEDEKTNPLVATLKAFLSGVLTILKKAMGIISKAAAFTLIAAAVLILVKTVKEMANVDLDLGKVIKVVVGMIALGVYLSDLAGVLDESTKNLDAGKGVAIFAMAAAIQKLAAVVAALGEMPVGNMLQGLGGVATLVVMFGALGKAFEKTDTTKAVPGLVAISAALLLLTPVIAILGALGSTAVAGAVIVTILGGVLLGLTAVLSAIGDAFGKNNNATKGIATMFALVGALALLTPVLVILGALSKVAFKGIGVMVVALGALVALGAISGIPLVTAGLAALSTTLTSFGTAMLMAGGGCVLFAAGLAGIVATAFVVFAALKAVFNGIAQIDFSALIGSFIEGVGNIFSAIWDAIVTYAPVLFDKLLELAGEFPGWVVNTLPIIISGLVALFVKIGVAIANIYVGLKAVLFSLLKGLIKGIVDGIAGAAGPIGNALKYILMGFINLIVDGLGGLISKIPGTDWIVEKLESWREGMQEKLQPEEAYEMGENYSESYAEGVEDGGEDLENALDKMGDETEKAGEKAAESGETYGKEYMHGAAKSMEKNDGEVKDAATNVVGYITDAVSNLGSGGDFEVGPEIVKHMTSSITESSGDLTTNGQNILNGALEDIDLTEASELIGSSMPEGITVGYSEMMPQVQGMIEQSGADMESWMRDATDTHSPSGVFQEIGRGFPEGLEAGIVETMPNVQSVLTTLAVSMFSQMTPLPGQFRQIGSSIGSSFASGISGMAGTVRSAASSLVDNAKSGVSGSSLYDAGKNAAQGFINGFKSKYKDMYDAGYEGGKKMKKGTQDALDEKSPSREMRKVGRFAGDGLVLGLRDRFASVEDAGRSAGANVIDVTKSALKNIASIVSGDLDMDPTIRPVLDLSDIKQNAGMIDRLLPNGSVGLSFATAAGVSGSTVRVSNADVVNAVNALRGDLSRVPRTNNYYNVGGVTYDDGSNVSDAVRTLIRATRVKRRS